MSKVRYKVTSMKSVNRSLSIRTNNKTAQSVRASLDKATRQEETP